VVVRSCLLEEHRAVLQLWRASGTEPSATDDLAGLEALLRRSGADALLVADDHGELVGTLIAAWDGWRGHMYRLAVLPTHRRRGVARALVAEGERRLREAGARRVNAVVVHTNDDGLGFWPAAGYEFDERARRYVKSLG
jgi:ribosomal protein S18 acetylase RimI-like enzyme